MNILPLSPTSMSCSLTSWESPAAEYVELGVSLDSILVNNPNATYLAYANGDSMENVGIYSGDLLVIDRKPQAQHLDTVIVSLNGAFMCKIIDVRQRLLLSANSSCAPIPIRPEDAFSIEGVVIRSIRLHKPLPEFM
ncbi:Error-prone repair protein UmuD [Vibrio chagasii]|nr:Error-prone repair protein UmuD [Vibrio chagasii]CAH7241488.1 Error-prone repair protein UmuD [Vibrio chagasii]CAH7438588.1 Error-prone repair protein UmuD [Vibrio chagasii]